MSVYFVQIGRYIKVGYSQNPERRVANLFKSGTGKAAPHDCPRDRASRVLLATIPGDLNTERICHKALAEYAVGCEFFVDEPGVRDFMAAAQRGAFPTMTRPGGSVWWEEEERKRVTPEEEAQLVRILDEVYGPLVCRPRPTPAEYGAHLAAQAPPLTDEQVEAAARLLVSIPH